MSPQFANSPYQFTWIQNAKAAILLAEIKTELAVA